MAQPSEQFQGDMSRNEVEIDLNKFMAMVSEIGELKQKIMEMYLSSHLHPIDLFTKDPVELFLLKN